MDRYSKVQRQLDDLVRETHELSELIPHGERRLSRMAVKVWESALGTDAVYHTFFRELMSPSSEKGGE